MSWQPKVINIVRCINTYNSCGMPGAIQLAALHLLAWAGLPLYVVATAEGIPAHTTSLGCVTLKNVLLLTCQQQQQQQRQYSLDKLACEGHL
jgi:hypothetical protein